ncbi:MAG TPA: DNA primase [Anaerolineae bacterium]
MSVTDEIKERLDIVEVVSGYVPLKKAGRNYQGLCPFHSEKTPSFVVFPDTQSWHCFGACGIGGDIFTFIQKRENLDFSEALKLLAERAGIQLQAHEGPAPAAEQRLDRLREITANAASYFHHLLINADEAVVAREYLEDRGLLRETWTSWQLGYSLNSWDALKDRLLRAGYTVDELADAGVVVQREDGSGYYDRFRGRLVIPIRDVQGRVIGFGARMLVEDPARPQPKYINSPQSPLFDKSAVLFGLDLARKAIRDQDLAVMVEGYMDVLMSHQVGVAHVVAGMGTALTEQQLGQLKRYTRNITLALDPDAAGDHAVLRGLQTARETADRSLEPVFDPRGLLRQETRLKTQLRIATLPDGLDPDELARQDRERWLAVIAQAQPVVDYYLAVVSQEENLETARGKANLVARLAPLVHEIANPIERTHYIQKIARRVEADERLIAEQVTAARTDYGERPKGAPRGEPARRPAEPGPAAGEAAPGGAPEAEPAGGAEEAGTLPGSRIIRSAAFGIEEHVLAQLLVRPDLLARTNDDMIALTNSPLNAEDFEGGENRAVLAALQDLAEPGADDALDQALDRLPQPVQERCLAWVQRIRRTPALPDDKTIKDLGDAILRLRRRNLDQASHRLQFMMSESQSAGERERWQEYKKLMGSYVAQERRLSKLLFARTMAGSLIKDNGTL